jgi:hypothetical protein
VVFICGEIKDLVSDSDKYYTYLEDPDDIDLSNELSGLNEDEVEDLKRECVTPLHLYLVIILLTNHHWQLGTLPYSRPRTQPPHSKFSEEN